MPEEIYNSKDYCALAEELERWVTVAEMLADELTELRENTTPVFWEDASESSPALIAYSNLLFGRKEDIQEDF